MPIIVHTIKIFTNVAVSSLLLRLHSFAVLVLDEGVRGLDPHVVPGEPEVDIGGVDGSLAGGDGGLDGGADAGLELVDD